ncbi:MAG: aminotransferase class I/II-fold pyridoxal phosphate-dependent enzyme [Alphaproteobacteria bacterium]|nr:aminotransferase class I/II-fold pyridoxal phosphate-dependent enzyme [Alphaproteobacteria bacterium]
MANARLEGLRDYPFERLAKLLANVTPRGNTPPINLSIGEPQHQPPAFLHQIVSRNGDTWNRYPPQSGTPDFKRAAADWLDRRYELPQGMIDPDTMIVACAGTREGLYMAATVAISPAQDGGPKPLALMPNPVYQVYVGASTLAGAEPVYLPATAANGFLPDLDAISADVLSRTQIMYLCTPSNPQGAVASLAYLEKALRLARQHDFVLVSDECYGEVYSTDAVPVGALQAAASLGGSLDNLMVFHTLSKRSSAPGLRSGFGVGAPSLTALMVRLRSYACAATPLSTLEAAAALWRDDAHVAATRALYRRKFDDAERILAKRFGFYRPAGGFYLWLDVGDGEAATRKLWEVGVRVLPGGYLTRPEPDGTNLGAPYIRVALVGEVEATEEALHRIARTL